MKVFTIFTALVFFLAGCSESQPNYNGVYYGMVESTPATITISSEKLTLTMDDEIDDGKIKYEDDRILAYKGEQPDPSDAHVTLILILSDDGGTLTCTNCGENGLSRIWKKIK